MEAGRIQVRLHVGRLQAGLHRPTAFIAHQNGRMRGDAGGVDARTDLRQLGAHAGQFSVAAVLLPGVGQNTVGMLFLTVASRAPAEEDRAASPVRQGAVGPQAHPAFAGIPFGQAAELFEDQHALLFSAVVIQNQLGRARRVVVHPRQVDGLCRSEIIGVPGLERLEIGGHKLARVDLMDHLTA